MIGGVKQVDNETIAEVLRIRGGVDQSAREPQDPGSGPHPWLALLDGFAHQDVIDAVWMHYSHESRAVWPADVIARVEALAAERVQAAESLKDLALQERSDWTDEQRAAWMVVWDEALGRGESVENAVALADEAAPDVVGEEQAESEVSAERAGSESA